jgi:hypothetical protein
VIHQVDVVTVAIIESANDAPVRAHGNRPQTFELAHSADENAMMAG